MDAIENFLDFSEQTQWSDLPAEVVDKIKISILDVAAVSLAGVKGVGVADLSALATEWGGAPQATLVTTGRKVPAPLATLVNGVSARAWDLDDVHEQHTCHVTANSVPAGIAIAEAVGRVSGKELINAIALGTEMICRLSGAPTLNWSDTGMAMSYQGGYFGAALTAGKLLGLDRDQMRHAQGLASARVAGTTQGYLDGAMTVRLMQGISPEGGVIAALMAQKGITASPPVLEGKFGYFPTYHKGYYDRMKLVGGLGQTWQMYDISTKQLYPCCKYIHAPLESVIEAMQRCGATHEQIQFIEVSVANREVHELVCCVAERKWNPATVVDAQFSLPFIVAHAAVHGRVGLESIASEGLNDPQVRALLPRIRTPFVGNPHSTERGTFPMPGIVKIGLASGEVIHNEVVYVKGHPRNPMRFDDVAKKMRACAAFGGFDEQRVEQFIEGVQHLETVDNASDLYHRLVQRQEDKRSAG